MLDNAQRSGDQIRADQRKELRKKRARGAGDSSELSADCSGMSDDMLGDMDPDLGGHAESFTQAWEEVLDEDFLEQEQEQDEEQEQEGPEEQESWFADPDDRELHEAREQSGPESEKAPGPQSQPQGQTSAERRAQTDDSDQTEVSREAGEPDEPSENEAASPPPEPESVARKTAGDWNSLLAQSEGFLVAEEPASLDMELEEIESVSPGEFLEPNLVELTNRLIQAPDEHPGRRPLQILLSRFGAGVLRLVHREKVKVVLMPAEETLMHDEQVREAFQSTAPTGACYLPHHRKVVVETRCLLARPKHFHPVLYYFAHAFDHALGDEGFASFGSAVKANFQACQEGFNGQDFADSLAEFSPVRYFAQAVEAYLNTNDCSEALWSRNDLYDFDRSMYQYIEYLFRRLNG